MSLELQKSSATINQNCHLIFRDIVYRKISGGYDITRIKNISTLQIFKSIEKFR